MCAIVILLAPIETIIQSARRNVWFHLVLAGIDILWLDIILHANLGTLNHLAARWNSDGSIQNLTEHIDVDIFKVIEPSPVSAGITVSSLGSCNLTQVISRHQLRTVNHRLTCQCHMLQDRNGTTSLREIIVILLQKF